MKTKLVFAYFLYLSLIFAAGEQIGDYPLTDDTIIGKDTLKNQITGGANNINIYGLFYTGSADSARPTCVGTFLTPENSLNVNTVEFSENQLSFSFWFYPAGNDNDGYIWSIMDTATDPSDIPIYYVALRGNTLEIGPGDTPIQITGYKTDEWHLLIINLDNNEDDHKFYFKVYDASDPSNPIGSLELPPRETLQSMMIALGNYRTVTSGFSGFVYNLGAYDEILTSNAISELFSTTCDPADTCDICPVDGSFANKCIDFGCLYPVGVNEFAPIKLCNDDSCENYCNKDRTCADCLIPAEQRADGTCACPEEKNNVYKRGQISGCSNCVEGCSNCDEDTSTCSACVDQTADKNDGCKCPISEQIRKGSFGFCVSGCDDDNCDSCDEDYTKCSTCEDGYYLKSFACDACDPACTDCKDKADYCTQCSDGERVAFNGDCVCGPGFYSTYNFVGGENVLSCTACSDNCEACTKDCYMCTDISDSDNDENCVVFSLGYQIRFRGEIIHMKFSEELEKDLEKHDFSFKDKNNKWHDAAEWDLVKINDREYKVFTDLTKDDLPFEVAFNFDKVDPAPAL